MVEAHGTLCGVHAFLVTRPSHGQRRRAVKCRSPRWQGRPPTLCGWPSTRRRAQWPRCRRATDSALACPTLRRPSPAEQVLCTAVAGIWPAYAIRDTKNYGAASTINAGLDAVRSACSCGNGVASVATACHGAPSKARRCAASPSTPVLGSRRLQGDLRRTHGAAHRLDRRRELLGGGAARSPAALRLFVEVKPLPRLRRQCPCGDRRCGDRSPLQRRR
mmetsp:Transcript_8409/g.21524  ORF Transcript_8409/g.21524 Transcript_8409/m.21524 type:complete len:219 (+) Transcript_8409:283-939(+)